MNTLYFSPGSCAIGIHVLLEEIGSPYATELVNLREGAQHKPEFQAVSHKGKVPALKRDDGSVLTEFQAIAYWIAATNPAAGLLPADPDQAARAIEAMDYVVATMHMQGFARCFRPTNFSKNEADFPSLAEWGRQIVTKGFDILEESLHADYVAGPFSVGDAALFYVEYWAVKRLQMTLPPKLAGHYQRMMGRPSVAAMLQQEGLAA